MENYNLTFSDRELRKAFEIHKDEVTKALTYLISIRFTPKRYKEEYYREYFDEDDSEE